MQNSNGVLRTPPPVIVPFGVTYEKIGTIQRRLAWPLHKDDTLSRSGRSTDLNIYFIFFVVDVYHILVNVIQNIQLLCLLILEI